MRLKLPNLGRSRSWRRFAGEVGIIVIGVLLALGAEQLLDDWNWSRKIAEQRVALDAEVADIWDAMSARTAIQACVDRRLEELALVFERHDLGQPTGIIGPMGRPAVWSATDGALRMATADGSLSHMRFDDKQRYFAVAGAYAIFAQSVSEERDAWRVLQRLNPPAQLDSADWREVRNAYRDAVDSNRTLKFNLAADADGQWLTPFEGIADLPENTEAMTLPTVQELCRPAVAP